MSHSLVIIGAGGFGREVLDVAEAINRAAPQPAFTILGVVDSAPSAINLERLQQRSIPYLGTESVWLSKETSAGYVIGIGNPAVRAQVDSRWQEHNLTPVTLVHPASVIGSNTTLGLGSVVCAGAQISTNVTLGRHVHVNPNATVGHDSVIDDYSSVNPGAIVSGDVHIGDRSLVGAGAVILQGLDIGTRCVIGASACVTHDVQADSTVKGVPAK